MISWIQKYFQQHFRTIFAFLLAITIISFVFTIGAAPGIGHGERGAIKRPFFGLNLASAADAQRITGDAQLSAFVAYGFQVDGEQLQNFALQRYAAIALADQLHIPAPSAEELKQHLRTLRRFQGKDGEFDTQAYAKFRDSLKGGSSGVREDQIFRVLSDDFRAETVQKLFAGPGYVLPSDVRRELEGADTAWALAVAEIDYASFQPQITPSDAELTEFYESNKVRYQQAAKFSGSQISFPAASYLSKVNVSEDDVRNYYQANKARFAPAPVSATEPKPDELAAFEQAKPRVEAALRFERARRLALREAADLSVSMDDKKPSAAELAALVKAAGRTLTPVKPFSKGEPTPELGASAELSNEAFKLSAERLFSDGIATPTGAVILVWEATIPARQPELAEVREKVVADFVATKRRDRFADLGRTFRPAVEARLKAGEQFGPAIEAAAKAANVKVTVNVLPQFTLRQPARGVTKEIAGALESLAKGGVSDMILAEGNGKGIIVYAAEKQAPTIDESSDSYRNTKAQMANVAGNSTGNTIIGELVEREKKLSQGE